MRVYRLVLLLAGLFFVTGCLSRPPLKPEDHLATRHLASEHKKTSEPDTDKK